MPTVQNPSDKRRQSASVSADKTLAITDGGIVQNVIADGKVMTLPAVASSNVGLALTFRNGGVPSTGGPVGTGSDKSLALTISPNASDKIMGFGVAGTDNKDLINTKATSQVGDEVTLISDGLNGWFVSGVIGTWAFEA